MTEEEGKREGKWRTSSGLGLSYQIKLILKQILCASLNLIKCDDTTPEDSTIKYSTNSIQLSDLATEQEGELHYYGTCMSVMNDTNTQKLLSIHGTQCVMFC